MLREAAAGLLGLGVVGGAGAVVYKDDGTAKVTITDERTGKAESVTIEGGDGQAFSCPDGTQAKLEQFDIAAGRVKITLRRVERRIDNLDERYPGKEAPPRVANRYNRLIKQGKRLTAAYNAEIDGHNAILRSDCEPS